MIAALRYLIGRELHSTRGPQTWALFAPLRSVPLQLCVRIQHARMHSHSAHQGSFPMNRANGIVATAIVVMGVLFRGGLPSAAIDPAMSASTPEAQTTRLRLNDIDDPRQASCRYWRPGRPDQASPADNSQAPCGDDGWGIPHRISRQAASPTSASGITTIIATVPDPIHSSLTLEFDRSIEALTQAAFQYGYVSSYFWLPWRRSSAEKTTATKDAGAESQPGSDSAREKQPGLLILKQANARPSGTEADTKDDSHTGLIYLFLVAQSPALGVNGDQIQAALTDEEELAKLYGARRSLRQDPNEVDIIGPNSSGAAASLRAALESHNAGDVVYQVAGITSTQIAAKVLNNSPLVRYRSFGDDSLHERDTVITDFTTVTRNGQTRFALLTEAGTVFGQSEADPGTTSARLAPPLVIPFPRDIALLRNASSDSNSNQDSAGVSPYLHLSLKDSGAQDNVPPFAPQVYTFSQEAQWMAIARELKNHRINVVAVTASNVLDELFLIKSIHRDIPDIQVVVYNGGDLLFSRIGDNEPYIGTITFTAYPLTDLASVSRSNEHYNFPDNLSEAYFNAASYTFSNGMPSASPHLADYRNPFRDADMNHPPLWATVVGRDGYYPLSIVDPQPSRNANILPSVAAGATTPEAALHSPALAQSISWSPSPLLARGDDIAVPAVSPGLSWYALCIAVTLLCAGHGIVLLSASFWSPATHDLAVTDSDQPRRRSVYVNIAAGVLFATSLIVAFPVFPAWHLLQHSAYTALAALATLSAGLFSTGATLSKTHSFLGRAPVRPATVDADFLKGRKEAIKDVEAEAAFYPVFNLLALATAVVVPCLWVALCVRNGEGGSNSYLGLFFSYRSLFPASGVCPLLPIVLILLTWYIWAHLQTKRLRFSENRRPMMPGAVHLDLPHYFYVTDQALSRCSSSVDPCLYEKINCLLITRQLLRRSLRRCLGYLTPVLGTLYVALFLGFLFFAHVYGLDHFLRGQTTYPGPYEILVCGLFFPLLIIAITGCVRLVVVWAAMNRGLLESLERSPLRFAFSRMQGVSWISMLRQGGVYEYWRDMTRSMESMQLLLSAPNLLADLHSLDPATPTSAEKSAANLTKHLHELWKLIHPELTDPNEAAPGPSRYQAEFVAAIDRHCQTTAPSKTARATVLNETQNFLLGNDLPCESKCAYLNLMCAIECDFAEFAEYLIGCVLAPYWQCKRKVLVGNDPITNAASEKTARSDQDTPFEIQLAEEFVCIRYISLIRAVLINLRYLSTFVSTAFVLALLAWNSYPFQPRQWVDWTFTLLLFGIGAGVVVVFAQMHRSPILSRITGTTANELGGDFFRRLLAFGAVPFLTWLASQFPAVSSFIGRLLQSGLATAK